MKKNAGSSGVASVPNEAVCFLTTVMFLVLSLLGLLFHLVFEHAMPTLSTCLSDGVAVVIRWIVEGYVHASLIVCGLAETRKLILLDRENAWLYRVGE